MRRIDRLGLEPLRQVADAGDLVFGEGRIAQLAVGEFHLLVEGEAELHDRGAGQLGLDDARVYRGAGIGDTDQAQHPDMAGFGVDLDLGAGAADHPERRRVRRLTGGVIGRHIIGHIAAGADDRAGLHAVFAAEQFGDRQIGAGRYAGLGGECVEFLPCILGGEPHRVSHVKHRARAEGAHVVGRHVSVRGDDPHRLRVEP